MKRLTGAVALFLGLTACGGGLLDLAEGGIGGSGFTIGPISAFGSIYVNGVEYATDNAQVSIDGETGTADQLRVGMVVTVQGTQNADGATGTAEKISFADDLRGPLESLDSRAGTLSVAGQTVQVDERTVFDGVDAIADLALGDPLRISGLAQGEGEFLATRVQRPAQPDVGGASAGEVRLRGQVSALDSAARMFYLNSLIVDYSLSALLPATLENGQWLEAVGTLSNGVLQASRLRLSPPAQAPANAVLDVRGHITRFVSEDDFDLAFRPATINANTRFEFGSASDLRLGVELTARGKMNAQGLLVLEQVAFNSAASGRGDPGGFLIIAPLEAVDLAQRQMRLLGIALVVPPGAVLDNPSQPQARFGLADLLAGERLAVHGFINLQTGALVAERVQRQAFAAPVSLQAPATEVDSATGTLKLLGMSILSNRQTRYFDARRAARPAPGQPPPEGRVISVAEFFALAPGAPVNAIGQSLGSALLAERMILVPERDKAEEPIYAQ